MDKVIFYLTTCGIPAAIVLYILVVILSSF